MSRFHGLLLVRDEEDIIEECLRANLEWADTIWVLDSGSSDATWEIATRLAAEDPRVRPLVKRDLLFGQHLRSYMFYKARGAFRDGDWVVKLDADEFYEVPPPEFVRSFVGPQEGCIYYKCIYFRITSREVAAYENGKIDLTHDRRRPIAERRRFYKIIDYTEPRMFRYRTSMKFRETDSFPRFAGLVARRLIPMRHYPHRDPVQLRRRYELRSCMKRMGALESKHWDVADWRIDVINVDHGIGSINTAAGLALEEGQDSGTLHYWVPGEALPSTLNCKYDERGAKRFLKRIFYRWFVRMADRFVRGFRDRDFLERNRLHPAQATQLASVITNDETA